MSRDNAQAEVEKARAQFGHTDALEPDKTYFVCIPHSDSKSYRAVFPSGSRYLLHLTDVRMKHSKIPDELIPTKTMSINSWRDGADVIQRWGVWGDDSARFVLESHDGLFNYELKDWTNGNWPNEGFVLDADNQKSFSTDEAVILSYFGNEKLERGIILWLEPHSKWEARNNARSHSD